jgi:Concanavalin A-like lectin/glucanases superfamily/Secretion system C-terminal sorting domain
MKKTIYLLLVLVLISLQVKPQNNCLQFNGSNNYVHADAVATTLAGSTTLTMEAWFYCADVSSANDQMILAFNDATTGNISQLYIETSASTLKYAGPISSGTGSTLLSNTWYHVAVTLDASNNIKVYLNGVEDISFTTEANRPASGDRFSIAQEWDNTTASNFFYGNIDEVRIWNDVRTETEIRQNMYCDLPNPAGETNLVSYYIFNESSGTTLSDSKGSNNGTLTDMVGNEWQTSAAIFGSKNALDFDGSDDYVSITSDASLNNNTFSVEFWVKLDDTPSSWDGIIDKGRYSSGDEWYFLTVDGASYAPGALTIIFGVQGLGELWLDLGDNNWHHVVGTYDGSEMKAYLDGVQQGSVSASPYTATTNAIRIGENLNGSNNANIHLDEVRIWSDARTATEIRENMMKPLSGDESGLVAYYTFDNTSGTVLQDFSGNDNNGTLTNMLGSSDWVTSTAFNTWLNTSSSDWSTASNWSRGSAPSSSDNVGIYSYSGGTDVSLSGSPTVNHLLLGSSSSMTLSSGLTVNGNLIIESNLDLNGQIITLGTEASLVEDVGTLYGSTGYIQTTRDLSNISSENVGGIGAEITTSGNMGSTEIQCYLNPIVGSNGDEGINRYYKINPTNNTGLNATLVLNYNDSELNGNTESSLVLYKSTDNGVSWVQQDGIVNTSDNTITLSSIDGFSWWTAAETGLSLPVEMIDFSANCIETNSVVLHWSTASENNNSLFEIQQSYDGIHFSILGEVNGAGNSNSILSYEFLDEYIEGFSSYYRLKQIDFDGKFEYSDIVTVNCSEEDLSSIDVFPNPFINEITINFNVKETSEYDKTKILLQNILGEVILEVEIDKNITNYQLELDKNLASGIYFVVVSNENERLVKKLLKR